jgi:hypothetical protein
MNHLAGRISMNTDQQPQDGKQPAPQATSQATTQAAAELQQVHDRAQQPDHPDVDGLKDKKPEELTPEELRLMADTMPGEGPGD